MPTTVINVKVKPVEEKAVTPHGAERWKAVFPSRDFRSPLKSTSSPVLKESTR